MLWYFLRLLFTILHKTTLATALRKPAKSQQQHCDACKCGAKKKQPKHCDSTATKLLHWLLLSITKHYWSPVTALHSNAIMTSSNGNIFRVTSHLCGEFTGDRWIPRTVTRSFEIFFDLLLNKRLSKQSWGWWFKTPSCPLWRHSYETFCNKCKSTENAEQQHSKVTAIWGDVFETFVAVLSLCIRKSGVTGVLEIPHSLTNM